MANPDRRFSRPAPALSCIERRCNPEILPATAELVGGRGYNGVSPDEMADRLDVTKGSLHQRIHAAINNTARSAGRDSRRRLEVLIGTLLRRVLPNRQV